jgi:hypothetical protein
VARLRPSPEFEQITLGTQFVAPTQPWKNSREGKKALPRHPNLAYKIGYDDVLHVQHGLTFFPTVRSVWPVSSK